MEVYCFTFNLFYEVYTCITRHAKYNYCVPQFRTKNRAYNFAINGINAWNSLDNSIKTVTLNNCFKKHLKIYLSESLSKSKYFFLRMYT